MSFQRFVCIVTIAAVAFMIIIGMLQTTEWGSDRNNLTIFYLWVIAVTLAFTMVGCLMLYALYKMRRDNTLDDNEKAQWQNWLLFFFPISSIIYLWSRERNVRKMGSQSRTAFVLFLSISIFHICFLAFCITMGLLRIGNSWVISLEMAGNMVFPFVSILCLAYLFHMDQRYRFTKGNWGWIVLYFFFPLVGMIMAGRRAFSSKV